MMIWQTLSAKLSWSHFILLIGNDDPLKRNFYIQMAELDGWSTLTLRERIDTMLFERSALSKALKTGTNRAARIGARRYSGRRLFKKLATQGGLSSLLTGSNCERPTSFVG
jgi:predicted nuclease of restriction endonuclease-like (RecB) superfamily